LILRNLLKTQTRSKILAYRLTRYFSMTYGRFWIYWPSPTSSPATQATKRWGHKLRMILHCLHGS
jgi:hypothetical protein